MRNGSTRSSIMVVSRQAAMSGRSSGRARSTVGRADALRGRSAKVEKDLIGR